MKRMCVCVYRYEKMHNCIVVNSLQPVGCLCKKAVLRESVCDMCVWRCVCDSVCVLRHIDNTNATILQQPQQKLIHVNIWEINILAKTIFRFYFVFLFI